MTTTHAEAHRGAVRVGDIYKVNVLLTGGATVQGRLIVWEVQPTEGTDWMVLGSFIGAEDIYAGGWSHLRIYVDQTLSSYADYDQKAPGRLPTRCALPWTALTITGLAGQYEPRDPASNSAEIMREAARTAVERQAGLTSWDRSPQTASLRPLLAQAQEARGRLADAEQIRDDAIRALLAAGVRPSDIVQETGLSRTRVDQIRNSTR